VAKSITPSSIVVASKDQISCDLAGEAAILDLKKGIYFGLDEVGATVWGLLAEPRSVSEIQGALLERYDVDADRCARDLLGLLDELRMRGLIEVDQVANEPNR
jgi:hypothetical protein